MKNKLILICNDLNAAIDEFINETKKEKSRVSSFFDTRSAEEIQAYSLSDFIHGMTSVASFPNLSFSEENALLVQMNATYKNLREMVKLKQDYIQPHFSKFFNQFCSGYKSMVNFICLSNAENPEDINLDALDEYISSREIGVGISASVLVRPSKLKRRLSINDALYPLRVEKTSKRKKEKDAKDKPDNFLQDLDSVLGVPAVDPVVQANDSTYFVSDESGVMHDVNLAVSNARNLFDAFGFHEDAVRLEKDEVAATETVQHYKVECDKYLVHLREDIQKEVVKYRDDSRSNPRNGYKILTTCELLLPKEKSNDVACVTNHLLTRYVDGKPNNIDPIIKGRDRLADALKKYKVVSELSETLNCRKFSTDKVDAFHKKLHEEKAILTKRRDSKLMMFVKGLGVVAAGILGLALAGVGSIFTSYLAHKRLFGVDATHGGRFFSAVQVQKPINDSLPDQQIFNSDPGIKIR